MPALGGVVCGSVCGAAVFQDAGPRDALGPMDLLVSHLRALGFLWSSEEAPSCPWRTRTCLRCHGGEAAPEAHGSCWMWFVSSSRVWGIADLTCLKIRSHGPRTRQELASTVRTAEPPRTPTPGLGTVGTDGTSGAGLPLRIVVLLPLPNVRPPPGPRQTTNHNTNICRRQAPT